jgi:hypothetical protein
MSRANQVRLLLLAAVVGLCVRLASVHPFEDERDHPSPVVGTSPREGKLQRGPTPEDARAPAELPSEPRAAEVRVDASPPSVHEDELWRQVDETARRLADGTASLADVEGLLTSVAAMARLHPPSVAKNGTRSYALLDSAEDGRVVLTVDPGKENERDQYQLSVSRKAALGYAGPSSDVTGTALRVEFGFDPAGTASVWANSLVSIKQRDETVWASCSSAGAMPIGGSLATRDGNQVSDKSFLQATTQPDGKHAWAYSSGEKRQEKLDPARDFSGLRSLCSALDTPR